MNWCFAQSRAEKDPKKAHQRAPFYCWLEHYSESDRDKVYHSPFRGLARDEVISRLQEAGDGTHRKRHPCSRVQSPMILSLGTGDVERRVVPPSSSHDVRLCRRSRE